MKRTTSLLAALALAAAHVATAQINYSGGTYFENFDGLLAGYTANNTGLQMPNTATLGLQDDVPTLLNWKAVRLGGTGVVPFAVVTSYGENTGGRLYCYWLPIGATDHALGSLASGTVIAGFGTSFLNTSTDTYGSITLSFDREVWRTQSTTVDQNLSFAYGFASLGVGSTDFLSSSSMISYSALNATAPGSLGPGNTYVNGNADPYMAPVTATITGISWAPGDTFFIRWGDENDGGSDAGIAIDNLSMIAAVPEPSCGLLGGLGIALLAVLRRKSR
jgi:hypothetical protein